MPHPAYLTLGADREVRSAAYREWPYAPPDPDEIARIRSYLAQKKALGAPRFHAMVEKALNRPVIVTSRGRPRRATEVG